MPMLASDDDNREFYGAQNPDSALSVKFFMKPIQNNFKTQQQGRPIFDEVEFIRIETPGNRLSIIETFASDADRHRFPMQYARFKNAHSDEQVVGTPVEHWPLLTSAQAEELKALKFRTVDQIANAADAAIQNIGMIGGMSPFSFRERAKAFLAAAKDTSYAEKAAQEAEQRKQELESLKGEHARQMAEMQAQIAALTKAVSSQKPATKAGKTETEAI